MAFPFIFESNFEAGDNSDWDSETDTVSQLDFPHYSELARFPWSRCAPVDGAFCMRATLAGGTADAFVTEGDLNIAAAETAFVKFNMYFSSTFDATADDTVNVLELQETGNAAQITFGFRYVAATDVINFGIGKAAPTSFGAEPIKKNTWYTIELDATLDDGGSDDGTVDLYVTEMDQKAASVVHATQIASLDQAAVTHGVLGIQDHLATTTGVMLFDNFVMDDARVYPNKSYPDSVILLTKSGHAFVGPGMIDNASLLSGAAADCVLTIFDTDTGNVLDARNIVTELKNTANNELIDAASPEMTVYHGCYVQISGTNPRALIQMVHQYKSINLVRIHGARRTRNV